MTRLVAQALRRRAPLQAVRAGRGRPVGGVPRLPADHHGVRGLGGFTQSQIRLDVDFAALGPDARPGRAQGPAGRARVVAGAGLDGVLEQAAVADLWRGRGRIVRRRLDARARRAIDRRPDAADAARASCGCPCRRRPTSRPSATAIPALEKMVAAADAKGAIRTRFNPGFLTASDATDSSAVGVWGALKGSFLTIMVTMLLAFPIGVLSALYLEEFAPRNRWTDIIEVSRSTTSPRCRRSSSACSGSRCSSTSCTCRARRRWSAG